VEAPGKFSEMRLSDLSFFRLEEGIALRTVTVEGHDEESGELPTIDFYSDGTATRAALVFETPGGATWTVTVTPMTSALRVYDFDIAEREEMQ
jgi:hypothetical protein